MKLKKKLKKIIAILSAVVVAFSCFIVNVSAAGSTGTIYSIPMNQPTADEYSGYIEMRYRNTSTGQIIPVVGFWRVYPVVVDGQGTVNTGTVWEEVEDFSWKVTNEYYTYSNCGFGKSLDIPSYQGALTYGVTALTVLVFFAVIFKGVLFKCLKQKR